MLHHAAMTGQVETLRFVIAHGDINVNYMSSDGWTPVQLAVRSSGLHRIECFEILVKNGADVIDVNTPLKSLIYVLGSIKRDMANEQIAIVILNKFREVRHLQKSNFVSIQVKDYSTRKHHYARLLSTSRTGFEQGSRVGSTFGKVYDRGSAFE